MAEAKASSAPKVLAPRQSKDAEAESFLGGPGGKESQQAGPQEQTQGDGGENSLGNYLLSAHGAHLA